MFKCPRLTGDGTKTYGYDYDNRLTSAGTATLEYDPASRLYPVGGSTDTRFLYDGSDAIAEYDASGNVLRRYVHGPGTDEPFVWYEGSTVSDRRWPIADERGSVIGIANNSATVTQVNKYDAYGVPDAANQGRFQYTGQMWLAEAGLYHYKARAYNPRLGRFMQTDPIGYAGGTNLYGYVSGDPVNRGDPSGMDDSYFWCSIPTACRTAMPPTVQPIDQVIVSGQRCDLSCQISGMSDFLLRMYLGDLQNAVGPGWQPGPPDAGGGGGEAPQGNQQDEKPCSDITRTIQDYTGGESNQSFVDDVVNNFVDVKDTAASTVLGATLSIAGGGTAAKAYGGVTAGQLAVQAWRDYRGPFAMTGIGFRSFSSAFATAGATWVVNSVLIKGSYNAGLLAGSIIRTGINRAATAACRP